MVGALLALSIDGCRVGVAPEDVDRSVKQYELAIGLRAEGNVPGAFQTLYRALDYDPDNAKAHLLLANMFLLGRDDHSREYDEKAEKHFRDVLRIQASERRDVEHNVRADALNGLGVLYIHEGRHEEALEVLREAADDLFNRQAHMAWGNIGWAEIERKHYPEAIEALSRAVKLSPQFCVGYYRLGQAYLATGASEEAEGALTRALEVDERCATFQDAWHLRGEARMKLGSREDAHADFERCVELAPSTDIGKACGRYLEATY